MERRKLWKLESPKSARDFARPTEALRPVAQSPRIASKNGLRSHIRLLQASQTVITATRYLLIESVSNANLFDRSQCTVETLPTHHQHPYHGHHLYPLEMHQIVALQAVSVLLAVPLLLMAVDHRPQWSSANPQQHDQPQRCPSLDQPHQWKTTRRTKKIFNHKGSVRVCNCL